MIPFVVRTGSLTLIKYHSYRLLGRAIAVGATEAIDLRDDIEGLNAGIVMKEYLKGEAKEFMAFFGQRP